MKIILNTLFTVALCFPWFNANADSQLVLLTVEKMYIPSGFDDNDDFQLVVSGTLPDTCHKIAHVDVTQKPEDSSINVVQWGRRTDGLCLPMSVPFSNEVIVGRLQAGNYTLTSPGSDSRSVNIAEAGTDSQDDSIYAPVRSVVVGRLQSTSYSITMVGDLPNDCFSWSETKILDQGDVFVLLPILSYTDNGNCSQNPVSFEKNVEISNQLSVGRYLLHVRSMSGKALNKMFFADGD